jgi:hypothetical protein
MKIVPTVIQDVHLEKFNGPYGTKLMRIVFRDGSRGRDLYDSDDVANEIDKCCRTEKITEVERDELLRALIYSSYDDLGDVFRKIHDQLTKALTSPKKPPVTIKKKAPKQPVH